MDVIIRILALIENKILNLDSNKILNLVFELSENKLIDKIDFNNRTCGKDIFKILDNLSSKETKLIEQIKRNLKETSIQDRLKSFTNLKVNEKLFENDTFLTDLKSISLIMNGRQINLFDWDIFITFESFKFFTLLFKYILARVNESSDYECETNEELFNVLRDLVTILEKIAQPQLAYEVYLMEENFFEVLLEFMGNISLVKYMFECNINLLNKIMYLFISLSRFIYLKQPNYLVDFVSSTVENLSL